MPIIAYESLNWFWT